MAKNTKNNLYDVEKDDKKTKKTNKTGKTNKNKKITKSNKNVNKKEKNSFDNEIIIGVTNLTREHIEENNKKKKKKLKKESNKKENKKEKKKEKKKTNDSKKRKNEVVEKVILDEEVFLEQRKEERKEKRIRKFRIAKIIMIICLIIATILIILFSPLFNIKEIEIRDNELISTDEILNLSGIKKDINMFKVHTGRVSNDLKDNLYIEDVEIIRELPSKIIIVVKERKPSFIIEYANGYATIDKKGFILELNETKKDLPILQGLQTISEKVKVGEKIDKEDLNKVYIASKIIDIANSNDMNNLITRIDIESIKDIKIILESKDKTAYLGDETNLITKLGYIKQIIDKTEGIPAEIFVNMDLNSKDPIFRERV